MSAFGLYIHWPFCKAKCPYCDFNSHVRHGGVNTARFTDALLQEMAWTRNQTGPRNITSIFFGGGTPSLMPPASVGAVLEVAHNLWGIAADAEITLEANPTSVEAENFRGYRAAGVNRVSVGVQALNEVDLKALGRQHSPQEALGAFRLAASIFPRVSFDMIYARPHQTLAAWREELTRALDEQQGHMSLYQLTIEPETRYADLFAHGKLHMPDDDLAVELFELTQELTEKAGLSAYEVSNHATTGHESRHNLLYWRYGEYAGVGPGAHGRLHLATGPEATSTEKHPETWALMVEKNGHGLREREAIGPTAQAHEMLLMGLRIHEGIELNRYAELAGQPLSDKKIANLIELGFVRMTSNTRLAATPSGRRVLNAVIAELAN